MVSKVPLEGGAPVQLSDKDCLSFNISPDGKWVACAHPPGPGEHPQFLLIPFAGGPPVRTFEAPPTIDLDRCPLDWTPDSRAIVFVDSRGGAGNLWVQPIAGGPPRPLTQFTTEGIHSFAWSRDGKQLAIARGNESAEAVLITNFR